MTYGNSSTAMELLSEPMKKNVIQNMPPVPFSCSSSPKLPQLLRELNCSIAITTYQAGKLIFISAENGNRLTMLARNFIKPMGFEVKGDKMVLAANEEVLFFENSKILAAHYPNKKNTYDNLFLPRATFYTGQVDIHDIAFGADGIWAVNTSFSCICCVTGNYNFIPVWKPSFISEIVCEDRCHLNGMVMLNGKPKYVTALGNTNKLFGWKENIVSGGVLIDVETNEIILEKLSVPHSPMLYKGELYLLLSGTGEIIKVNVKEKSYEVVAQTDGFCRGMDIYNDYIFAGMSKLRENSSSFSKLSFKDNDYPAGVKIFHLPTGSFVGEVAYKTSVEEIYGLKIIENALRPNILNAADPIHKYSLSIPNHAYWAKDAEKTNAKSL
jgi:uncharacterized protein (TIGR03032 family)